MQTHLGNHGTYLSTEILRGVNADSWWGNEGWYCLLCSCKYTISVVYDAEKKTSLKMNDRVVAVVSRRPDIQGTSGNYCIPGFMSPVKVQQMKLL